MTARAGRLGELELRIGFRAPGEPADHPEDRERDEDARAHDRAHHRPGAPLAIQRSISSMSAFGKGWSYGIRGAATRSGSPPGQIRT